MQVVVTGAAGFLGRWLVERLTAAADPLGGLGAVTRVVAVDAAPPPFAAGERLVVRQSDLGADAELAALVGDADLVFHLAAVVSGQAEAEFDLGMRVNLDLTRRLLEALRRSGRRARLVFASSIAVFGRKVPEPVGDDSLLAPETSYGTQKAIGELLVNDYSRKGFIDGRAVRLPTVVVRDTPPNRAASTFASTIIRDPVAGREAVCPVRPETRLYILSPERAVEALIHAARLPAEAWGRFRAVTLPGLTVSVREMLDALAREAGAETAARVRVAVDPTIQAIVDGWPSRFTPERALAMGFRADPDVAAVVRQHLARVGRSGGGPGAPQR